MDLINLFCQTRDAKYLALLPVKYKNILLSLAYNNIEHPLSNIIVKNLKVTHIKGPIKVDLFTSYDNKTMIYLFYDEHTFLKNTCSGSVELSEFLADNVKYNDQLGVDIDLFLEIPHIYSNYKPNNGYINNVRNKFITSFAHSKLGDKDQEKITSMIDPYNNLRTYSFDLRWKKGSQLDSYNKAFRALEHKHFSVCSKYLLGYIDNIKESFDRDSKELGINDIQTSFSDELYITYLSKVTQYILEKKDSIIEATSTKSIPMLEKIFIRLGARFVDYYLLSFITSGIGKTFKNIIIFSGDYHCYNYREFFLSQKYKLTYESSDKNKDRQCLAISGLNQPLFS